MNNSRRGFLGKLLGVVALPLVIEKLPNKIDSNRVRIKYEGYKDISQHYVAGYSRVSKEMLNDLPFLQQYTATNANLIKT